MWRHVDGDQRIARPAARARPALAFQPDLLTTRDSRRDLDIDVLAVRQVHARLDAFGRIGEDIDACKSCPPAGAAKSSVSNGEPRAEPPRPNIPRSRSSKPAPPPPLLERRKPSGPKLKLSKCAPPPGWKPPLPGCAPKPSKPWKRGLPSASISPRSNALRLSASPTTSYAALSSAKCVAALGSCLLASGCNFFASRR